MNYNTEIQKFSSQADSGILSTMRNIAKQEGKQFQSVLNEAMEDFISKKQEEKPRKEVLALLEDSINEFDYLYKKLAE